MGMCSVLCDLSAANIIVVILAFLFRDVSLSIICAISKEASCVFNHSSLFRRRSLGRGQARLLWPKADIEDSSRVLQRDPALDV
jgi:hypothetical protein